MLKFIDKLPQNTIGIEVSGEVTRAEYETVILPKINDLASHQRKINYVILLKSGFSSFSIGAWWDDFKFAIKYAGKWNKIAVVTDELILKYVIELFKFAMPGKHKVFKLDEFEEAIWWVSAS